MSSDARHHPRVTGTAGVELHSQEGWFVCRARDVSLAGCYLETRNPVRSQEVQVVFQVPGHGRPISCDAQVVRKDPRADGTVGLALRFRRVDWAALLGLAKLIRPQLA